MASAATNAAPNSAPASESAAAPESATEPARHAGDHDHGGSKCTYCEALKVPQGKRTAGMRSIIKQEELQMETFKFLEHYLRFRHLAQAASRHGFNLSDHGQSADLLVKALANTVKALMHLDGSGCALKFDNMKVLLEVLPNELKTMYSVDSARKTVLQQAKGIKSPLQMLTAVPLVMTALREGDAAALKRTADVALRAIELNCADWHDTLKRYGICTKDVEVILHVTLSELYCVGGEPPGMDYNSCHKAMAASVDQLWRLDPGNPWGALFTTMVPNDKKRPMKVLYTALAQAEKRGDEGARAMVLWEVAYNILLGWEGPTFEVSKFLDLVKRAEEAHGLAESWSYTEMYDLKRHAHIWRCRGVAAGIRADIRANPAVADNLHVEYTSEEDLDLETAHVTCDGCKQLKKDLLKCARCQEAKYCSKDCQKNHWVGGGHKRACRLVERSVTIGPVGYADR